MYDDLCKLLDVLTDKRESSEERLTTATVLAGALALGAARELGREEELPRRFPSIFRVKIELTIEPRRSNGKAAPAGAGVDAGEDGEAAPETFATSAGSVDDGGTADSSESGALGDEPELGWTTGNKAW